MTYNAIMDEWGVVPPRRRWRAPRYCVFAVAMVVLAAFLRASLLATPPTLWVACIRTCCATNGATNTWCSGLNRRTNRARGSTPSSR